MCLEPTLREAAENALQLLKITTLNQDDTYKVIERTIDELKAAINKAKGEINQMKKLTEKDTGCWLDGVKGWQAIGEGIMHFAYGFGWEYPKHADNDIGDKETFDIDVDEAEKYLNSITPEDLYFGDENGDWGLWKVESN